MKTAFILMGPPGSGKGTQAKRIAQALSIPHISTGDLFRENISNETELGEKVKHYIEAGKYVPDEITIAMLNDRLSQSDTINGYLLDGFPRTVSQANALETLVDDSQNLIVISLNVADDVIVSRLSGRLQCKNCRKIYHVEFSPPKKEGICDTCQGTLYQRNDDQPDVIRKRLLLYHEQTKPVLDYYSKRNHLLVVDGEKHPDEVFTNVMTAFEKEQSAL